MRYICYHELTLKQFRDFRNEEVSNKEEIFEQLFRQWIELQGKLTVGEAAAYSNEARKYRELIGLTKANEIMDKVTENTNKN